MVLYEYFAGKGNKLDKRLSLLYQAEPALIINMPTGEAAPVFDYKTFPFEIFLDAPTCHKKGKSLDHISYINLACSFDIEATTILTEEPAYAFMYQWQYCIEDYVFMGSTWEQFEEFSTILSLRLNLNIYQDGKELHGRSLVTYIHNFSYEFQFMRYFLGNLVNPLITDKYCPLLIHNKIGHTYRCSYRLSNKSLEAFTKGFEHAKLAGDLDYEKIRYPHPEDMRNGLTDLELAYCYNDVKGLSEAIRDRLEKDRYNIATIPLTSTGYVRKDTQRSMNANTKNRGRFQDTKLTPNLYRLCRAAFRGGNTHANAAHTGKLIGIPCKRYPNAKGGKIHHFDLGSSYPASTLTQTYPMGPFVSMYCNPKPIQYKDNQKLIDKLEKASEKWCMLLRVRMTEAEYIGTCGVPYIAKSKTLIRICDQDKIIEDNGRIFKAPLLEVVLTEIDLDIILKNYKYKDLFIVEAYKSWRGMLPEELRAVVLDYYKRKTLLKHSETEEDKYNYAKAKENLNSTYGMMVMRIDRLEFEYVDNEYVELHKTLQEQIDKYYDSKSNCLQYQWGVWVTAHSRARLQRGLDICGPDLIYTDTDSVFFIGDHVKEFEELNKELEAEAISAGAVAQNKFGESFPIGLWDREPDCLLFETLGAKKYLYSLDGVTIESTIAGVSKKLGKEYFTKNGFEAFKDGTCIKESGKIQAVYNNDKPHYIEHNGQQILTASNIAMIPTEYTVHLTPNYRQFIEYVIKSLKQ